MNESDERFIRQCNEYPRVAIGSCGEYDVKRPRAAVARMDLIRHVVDDNGYPAASFTDSMLNRKYSLNCR